MVDIQDLQEKAFVVQRAAISGHKYLFEVVAAMPKVLAELAVWRDYFGCDDPHGSHAGEASALGKEQERANRLEAKLKEALGLIEQYRYFLDADAAETYRRLTKGDDHA